jgi:hypothetical protein
VILLAHGSPRSPLPPHPGKRREARLGPRLFPAPMPPTHAVNRRRALGRRARPERAAGDGWSQAPRRAGTLGATGTRLPIREGELHLHDRLLPRIHRRGPGGAARPARTWRRALGPSDRAATGSNTLGGLGVPGGRGPRRPEERRDRTRGLVISHAASRAPVSTLGGAG